MEENKDIRTIVREFVDLVQPIVHPEASFTSVDEFIEWAEQLYQREGWKPTELHFSLADLRSNFGKDSSHRCDGDSCPLR